jgi:uncharacterized protein (TIGR03435 family)
MLVRKISAIIFFVLIVSISCEAQQSTLTVDAVLARVRENITEYKTAVPSFIADESVLSQRFVNGKLKGEMKIESSFELKRMDTNGDTRETRTVKLVDGRALKENQGATPPYRLTGGVSNVIRFFEDKCSDFRFAEEPGEETSIVIERSRKLVSDDCPLSPQIRTGKAFLDPVSFQVIRLDQTSEDMKWMGRPLSNHSFPSDHNVFTALVDYAPVELGGKTYWLTKSVTSDESDKPGIKKPVHLHYEAHYSNYHRYASTVKLFSAEPVAEQVVPSIAPIEPSADAITTPTLTAAAAAPVAPAPTGAPEKTYAFDVVSMRQNKTTAHQSLRDFGATADGYRVQNMSLRTILITAFAPKIGGGAFYTSDQIRGIPDWADSVHYDVEARISDADRAAWQNPERQKAMLRAMIQSMLEDRCKLVVHREVNVTKVYSLELAKGGPKFQESKPDEVFPSGIKLPWGGVVVPAGDGMRMYGTTMASFATVLAERTDSGRTIQDKTGLTGKYDITLKADASLNPPSAEAASNSDSESDWDATMLAAVDSLGLKLVSTKAPVEMLIVDHLDRPSEN